MSAIRVDQNILNQRGTPAFFADDFSRRPAAGYKGRIFISADTHEIYRDDTTAWVLIADAGAGSGTLQSVTANGNTTSYGIDILGVGLRVQAGGITDYTIPSGGIMFGSPSYLLTTDTTNLFWDDTNNRLGLGTNTPGARLDIHATGTNATFNGTGTSNSTLVFQRSGTSRWTIGNYYSSAVADDFNIYDNVNSQYRFYVHNTGVINIPTSLIIGSSTPTSSYILDVTGNSNVTGTFRTTGITSITSSTASTSTTTGALIVTGGLGIGGATYGTSAVYANSSVLSTVMGSPQLKLINNAASTINQRVDLGLRWEDGTYNGIGGISMVRESATARSGRLVLSGINSAGDPNDAVNITSGGNVNIAGSVSSNTRLTVTGVDSTSSNYAFVANNASTNIFLIRNDGDVNTGTAAASPVNNTTTSLANMFVASGGTLQKSTASSQRFKENIQDWIGNGLNTILALKPKTFTYKEGYYNNPELEMLGLIAEEVAEVSPYLAEYENEDRTGQVENVRYATIVVPLIKAIQEQQAQIEELKAMIAAK
jgi:hypothetical protein